METSLHRQLKQHYAGRTGQLEVSLRGFRIDAVRRGVLVEIQHGSLSAIKRKTLRLLDTHRVLVVKPIIFQKQLVRRATKGGRVVSRRRSPKRGQALDVFAELVYFTRVFPHRNLCLEVPLVEIEEWRYPGRGRRRWRRQRDHVIEDQKLINVCQVHRFRTAEDLATLLPTDLPSPFHSGDIAQRLRTRRWMAQRIAYCLRHTGATVVVGKRQNTLLYQWGTS